MIFNKLFGKKKEPAYDATNITVRDLDRNFILEYDLKTWQVAEAFEYDWGNNFFSDEYKLISGSDALFLYVEDDDELELSVSRKISLAAIDQDVASEIMEREEPPRTITCEGQTYKRIEESMGHYRDRRSNDWSQFISWTFEHKDGKNFITVERWGEEEFEASKGHYVEEYQISNILPGNP